MSDKFFKPPLFEDITPDAPPAPPIVAEVDESEGIEKYQPALFSKQQGIPADHDISAVDKTERRFKNSEFIEEASLLTNVEEYSKRVREEADQYTYKVREEAELIKSELELERGKVDIIIQEAKDEAAKILQDAKDSRQATLDAAQEEGYQAGFEQGKQDLYQQNQDLVTNFLELIKEVKDLRITTAQEQEAQFVELALTIAQKVVRKELTEHKDFVLELLQENIGRFEGMGKVKIRINPLEYDYALAHSDELKRFLEEQQNLTMMADAEISPGQPLIESSYAAVDLDLKNQFAESQDALHSTLEARKPLFVPKHGREAEEE